MPELRKLAAEHGVKGTSKVAIADKLVGSLHVKATAKIAPPVGQPPASPAPTPSSVDPPLKSPEAEKLLFAKTEALPKEQRTALRGYSGDGHEAINKSFRRGKPSAKALAAQEAVKAANGLPARMTVYRGLFLEDKEKKMFLSEMQKRITTGGLFQHEGLVSTSLNPTWAATFSERNGVMLSIKAKTGAYLEPMARLKGEHEIVQAHGTKYKPVRIEKGFIEQKVKIDKGGGRIVYETHKTPRTIIHMEEV